MPNSQWYLWQYLRFFTRNVSNSDDFFMASYKQMKINSSKKQSLHTGLLEITLYNLF